MVADEPILYLAGECACTTWPIAASYPVRPCGICGIIPVITGLWDEEAE